MTRREFTIKICQLILEMAKAGEQPVVDYFKRSEREQKYLFDQGLSACDGIKNISRHQKGTAGDIYFVDKNGNIAFDWDIKKSDYWHQKWVEVGGRPRVEFKDKKGNLVIDHPHFEG